MALTTPTIDARPNAGTRVLILGDSFVEWYGNNTGLGGGCFAPMGWDIQRTQANHHDTGGLKAKANRTIYSPKSYLVGWANSGVSGTGMGDIAANYTTRVLAQFGGLGPTLIYCLASKNDWAVSGAAWTASANTAFNAIDAALPAVNVVLVANAFGNGEHTTSSGWDQSIESNASVTSLNANGVTWVGTRDANRYMFMDIRGDVNNSANTSWGYERANNPSGASVLLRGDFHPVDPIGQRQFSNWVLARTNVVYT